MIKQVIFPKDYSSSRQIIVFDNSQYIINLSWQSTPEIWTMDLHDSLDRPIFDGKILQKNTEILNIHTWIDYAPQGELWITGNVGDNSKIQYADFWEEKAYLTYSSES